MSDPLFSVEDKAVLVSGGSRGIGRAIAEGFAQRGAKVIVTGRDADALQKTAEEIGSGGRVVVPVVCDVAKSDQIGQLVETTISELGRIDVLVNVAGVNLRKPALDYTEEEYDFILDVNLKGAFLLSQAVARHMREQGEGNQINIASINNDRPLGHITPYAMSKAGMGHMTRSFAMEWGEYGIRVNAICPGFILTEMAGKIWKDPQMPRWRDANTPLRRIGTPDDMIGTAIFLASDASRFLTGQSIYVDGGFTAGWSWPVTCDQ